MARLKTACVGNTPASAWGLAWIGSVVALALVTGCNEEDEAQPDTLNYGLPADRQLGQLDDAEIEQLCAETVRFFREVHARPSVRRGLCAAVALVDASDDRGDVDVTRCNEIVEECLAELDASGNYTRGLASVFVDEECDLEREPLAGCEATVAEFEACQNDLLPARFEQISDFSCETAGDAFDIFSGTSDACELFVEKCHNLGSVQVSSTDGPGFAARLLRRAW